MATSKHRHLALCYVGHCLSNVRVGPLQQNDGNGGTGGIALENVTNMYTGIR